MILRALVGCLMKDLKSAWTEKSTLLQCMTLPVNYLILLSLFALAGSNAPTAVVMQENGPYAKAFIQAMRQAHSFSIRIETVQEAAEQYRDGTLVSVVTIPANFDTAVTNGQPIAIPFEINNLNQDLTDDATRGMRLAVTTFYAQNFPLVAQSPLFNGAVYREYGQMIAHKDFSNALFPVLLGIKDAKLIISAAHSIRREMPTARHAYGALLAAWEAGRDAEDWSVLALYSPNQNMATQVFS